jgi:hypothetical protein
MPARAFQSAAPLVQTAGALPLPEPSLLATFALTVADGNGALDWTGIAGVAFRVVRAWFVKTGAPTGAVAASIQLRNAAGVAITDAMSINGLADTGIVRTASINDATHEVAAGVGLQVNRVQAAGNVAGILYVTVALTAAGLGKLRQSGARLVETAGANPLPSPSIEGVFALTIPQAKGTTNWTGRAGMAFRVLEAWYVKTDAAVGVAAVTLVLQDQDGNLITNAMDISAVVDQGLLACTAIDDANHLIPAGEGLRVVTASANVPDCRGILYVRVALV